MNGIGQRIREARSLRGWSQNELASRAGVKQPTLQRIEAGLRLDPSIRTIAALAGALEMTIDALLDLPQPGGSGSEATRLTPDTIAELREHIADIEQRLDVRVRTLEETIERRNVRGVG